MSTRPGGRARPVLLERCPEESAYGYWHRVHGRRPRGAATVVVAPPPVRRCTRERVAAMAAARQRRPTVAGIGPGPVPRRVRRALPAWHSRAGYLAVVEVAATDPACARLCRQYEIAVGTWRAAMHAMATEADLSTGMLWASHTHLGALVNRSAKVIQRALAVARALGLALEVYRGRELGRDERLQLVAQHHQHPQRGIPSGWQLAPCPPARRARFSTPRPGCFTWLHPLDSRLVHLPPSGGVYLPTHLGMTYLGYTRADAATPRRHRERRRRPAGLDLARRIGQIVPWLAAERPSRLAPALTRFATSERPWSAQDVAWALADQLQRRGLNPDRHSTGPIRTRPAVVLAGLLRDLDLEADHPSAPAFPQPPTGPTQTGGTPDDAGGGTPDHAGGGTTRAQAAAQWAAHTTHHTQAGTCDGHGWIQINQHTVTKCPRCAHHETQPGDHDWAEAGEQLEPPF